jgi:NCAIR mutase (PurE)-related protein
MNDHELRTLLDQVREGTLEPARAADRVGAALRAAPFEDLGFARLDTHREVRQGFPEVVLGLGKTPEQIGVIAEHIAARGQSLLVTRADMAAWAEVRARLPEARYHHVARTITLAQGPPAPGHGTVLVATAGTSDEPVAEEAAVTAELMGNAVDRLFDVGVAGLHRLLAARERLESARVIIVVAGMEAHTFLRRTFSDVAALFGRDRTTVSYACAKIEDLRERRRFDEEMGALEDAIPRPVPPVRDRTEPGAAYGN